MQATKGSEGVTLILTAQDSLTRVSAEVLAVHRHKGSTLWTSKMQPDLPHWQAFKTSPGRHQRFQAYLLMCSAGSLTRDFKHLAVDMFLFEEDEKKMLKVECHFGKRKNLAAIRTVCSHVQVRSAL